MNLDDIIDRHRDRPAPTPNVVLIDTPLGEEIPATRTRRGTMTVEVSVGVSPCDKSLADCVQHHGNASRFGGHIIPGTGRYVPCPHVFGDALCGAKAP